MCLKEGNMTVPLAYETCCVLTATLLFRTDCIHYHTYQLDTHYTVSVCYSKSVRMTNSACSAHAMYHNNVSDKPLCTFVIMSDGVEVGEISEELQQGDQEWKRSDK